MEIPHPYLIESAGFSFVYIAYDDIKVPWWLSLELVFQRSRLYRCNLEATSKTQAVRYFPFR